MIDDDRLSLLPARRPSTLHERDAAPTSVARTRVPLAMSDPNSYAHDERDAEILTVVVGIPIKKAYFIR